MHIHTNSPKLEFPAVATKDAKYSKRDCQMYAGQCAPSSGAAPNAANSGAHSPPISKCVPGIPLQSVRLSESKLMCVCTRM